jgi:hypothetical protein
MRLCRRVAPVPLRTGHARHPSIRLKQTSKILRWRRRTLSFVQLLDRVLRFVHSESRHRNSEGKAVIASNLSLGSGKLQHLVIEAHPPTSARFRGRASGPVSGRLYGSIRFGGPALSLPLSRCLSATGIRFLGVLFPPGDWASLTVG